MIRLVRSEMQKLWTIRSTAVLLALTAVAAGLIGLAVGLAPHSRGVAEGLFPPKGTVLWFNDVFSAMQIAQDFALVLGILVITSEYRHKTVTPTFLTEPRRPLVTAVKLLVSALGGAVVAVTAGIAGLVLGWALVSSGYGSSLEMLTQFQKAIPGIVAVAVLFAVYGLGIGSLLKNQVLALVTGLGVSAVVEPIIVGVWPSVGRWLPSQAARALEPTTSSGGFGGGVANLLTSWEGALVLLGYGLALAAAGSFTTMRADVT